EPFRTDKMTPENRLQTTVWLGNLYNHFLENVSSVRNIDTTTLFRLADDGKIQTAPDALDNKLVDGLKYDDEVQDEIKNKLGIGKYEKIKFISINKYAKAGSFKRQGTESIAVIYAQGDIIDGRSEQTGIIASENYMNLIRRARLDQ